MKKNRITNGLKLAQMQRGATLIEVLVSMLLLGLGVLVLLATQLKTVAGVREAENQTIVAQATQNLIEGMLANPTLQSASNINTDTKWNKKTYTLYEGNLETGDVKRSCNDVISGTEEKAGLALGHLCEFRQALNANLPDAAAIEAHICKDNSGGVPTISGTAVEWNCDKKSDSPTVVKVLWQMNTENENSASGITVVDGKAVFTYQARVTD